MDSPLLHCGGCISVAFQTCPDAAGLMCFLPCLFESGIALVDMLVLGLLLCAATASVCTQSRVYCYRSPLLYFTMGKLEGKCPACYHGLPNPLDVLGPEDKELNYYLWGPGFQWKPEPVKPEPVAAASGGQYLGEGGVAGKDFLKIPGWNFSRRCLPTGGS
eukprot:GHVT01047821.1.p1 GENE.GHVT01047821.1~~GHVT01047821.1.p1  ORF type:complete len:161 (+),score=11.45 GHVT01047821.1:678-1160(+)